MANETQARLDAHNGPSPEQLDKAMEEECAGDGHDYRTPEEAELEISLNLPGGGDDTSGNLACFTGSPECAVRMRVSYVVSFEPIIVTRLQNITVGVGWE